MGDSHCGGSRRRLVVSILLGATNKGTSQSFVVLIREWGSTTPVT
ncbi:hypothetical protein D931_00038 [Enterococcus faecium 13.SD.W.09]|nr:hypothetical protein D931_00038 [Enterococcus faecium 13.SD.W.09]